MKKAVEIDGVDLMGYTPWGCIDLVSECDSDKWRRTVIASNLIVQGSQTG